MKRAIARQLGAVGATTVVVMLGSAIPAAAVPSGGVYAIDDGGDGFFIVVRPTCVTDGCTADITSNRGWNGIATRANGRWDFKIEKPDGVVCEDGSYAPVVIDYSVDAVTLEGVLTADSNGSCPGGQVTREPFRLRKIANAS
jgi:hypothetical protein